MSVVMIPGETALTRMPSPASSFDRPMVMESTAPLDAAYQTYSPGLPSVAAIDEIITIAPPCPPCLVDMRMIAALAHSSAPTTLSSSVSRIGLCLDRLDARIPAGRAGVIDKVRQPPELLVDGRERAVDVGLLRHVALDRDGAPSGRLHGRHDSVGGLRVAQIVDRDVIAARARELRGRRADAAARAGDEKNLIHYGAPASLEPWCAQPCARDCDWPAR